MNNKWVFDKNSQIYYNVSDLDPDSGIWMDFIGKNVIGNISCRGTRLWINPEVMLYCKYYDYKPLEIFNDYPKDLYNNIPNKNYIFLSDDFSLRFENMDDFISVIEYEGKYLVPFCHYTDTLENIKEQYSDNFKSTIKSLVDIAFYEEDIVYFQQLGTRNENICIIHEYDLLLSELNAAYDIAKENNVTFIWI